MPIRTMLSQNLKIPSRNLAVHSQLLMIDDKYEVQMKHIKMQNAGSSAVQWQPCCPSVQLDAAGPHSAMSLDVAMNRTCMWRQLAKRTCAI